MSTHFKVKSFKRTDKTSQLIQEALAVIIQAEIRDPRLPKLVTLSHVNVSPDLSHAKVYLTALGDDTAGETAAKILNHAGSYLRTALTKSVNLRIAPRLHFIYDQALDESNKLSALIAGLEVEDDEVDKS
jgi:ribosome-binding factor A